MRMAEKINLMVFVKTSDRSADANYQIIPKVIPTTQFAEDVNILYKIGIRK